MRSLRPLALPALAGALALAAGAAFADFSDRGMRTGAVRTDLPAGQGTGTRPLALAYPNPGPDGCLFSVLDPANLGFGCPGLAGVRDKAGGAPGWSGTLQSDPFCGGASTTALGPASLPVGASFAGCVSYPGSPAFALNTPAERYWVLVANSDPSFDQCNDGPPGLSHRVRDPMADPAPALYKVAMEPLPDGARRAHLIINASDHPFHCDRPGYRQGPHFVIPFLSLGAHRDHGQDGPVALINLSTWPQAPNQQVQWTSRTWSYQPFGCDARKGEAICDAAGVHAGFYAIARWDGIARLLFIDTVGQDALDYTAIDPPHTRWNWPLRDSLFYPGAEVAVLTSGHLRNLCGMSVPPLPLQGLTARAYSVDLASLYSCAERLRLFSSPMPYAQDIPVEGFHWYLESVGTRGALWISVERPEVN